MTDAMARWKGKVALVTGGTSGIGLATVRRLAREGMRVGVNAREPARLAETVREVEAEGGQAIALPADLQNTEAIRGMFQTLRKAWGGVSVLVNNAGLGRTGDLTDAPEDDWREMLAVNVLALSVCTQQALMDMEVSGAGHIIHISSIAGHRVVAGRGAFYAATKHAVRALADGLRYELVAKGSPVKVSQISPGVVETGFHDRSTRGVGDSSTFYSQYQVLQPEDVADVVAYLLATPPHVNIHDVLMRSIEQPH